MVHSPFSNLILSFCGFLSNQLVCLCLGLFSIFVPFREFLSLTTQLKFKSSLHSLFVASVKYSLKRVVPRSCFVGSSCPSSYVYWIWGCLGSLFPSPFPNFGPTTLRLFQVQFFLPFHVRVISQPLSENGSSNSLKGTQRDKRSTNPFSLSSTLFCRAFVDVYA